MITLPPRFRHIVIEGPIGAGKTSLARKLAAATGAHLLLEQPGANPFLERFYRDSRRYALSTQLFFLFQRVQLLDGLKQLDLFHSLVVGDFLLEKDPLFARLTLADDEMRLYETILAQLAPAVVAPDLVIYLQANADTLIERITRRGDPTEAGITESYLRSLADAYTRFFHQYDAAPVLMVNTEHLNPIDRDADFELLISRIGKMRGRREYFNLAA
ncbi:MAG TPA: deoxynucleoside kinase [Burkholderiaceae bacterium]|nr:deoxynucleoside kinase [Burkholderiaceae bacterium]